MPKNSCVFSKNSAERKYRRLPPREKGELTPSEIRKRLPKYIESIVARGRKIRLSEAMDKATYALGMGESDTAQERWRKYVREHANVVFVRERVGRSWVIFVHRTPEVAAENSPPTFPYNTYSHPTDGGYTPRQGGGRDTRNPSKSEKEKIPPKLMRVAWGLARTWLADDTVLDGYCRSRLRCPLRLVARYIGRWLRLGHAISRIRAILRRRLRDHACLASIRGSRSWLCSGALSDADRELRSGDSPDPERHRGKYPGVTFRYGVFAGPRTAPATPKRPKSPSPRPSSTPPADPMQLWASEELARIWPDLVRGAASAIARLARFAAYLSPEDAARVAGLQKG